MEQKSDKISKFPIWFEEVLLTQTHTSCKNAMHPTVYFELGKLKRQETRGCQFILVNQVLQSRGCQLISVNQILQSPTTTLLLKALETLFSSSSITSYVSPRTTILSRFYYQILIPNGGQGKGKPTERKPTVTKNPRRRLEGSHSHSGPAMTFAAHAT